MKKRIYTSLRQYKSWIGSARQILTVIAAPISPCTTASPVDCTYRKNGTHNLCLKNWVKCHQTSLKCDFVSLISFWPLSTCVCIKANSSFSLTLSTRRMTVLQCNKQCAPPVWQWWPCWLHPECDCQGSSKCPGSLERNPEPSLALWCYRCLSVLPVWCTSSSTRQSWTVYTFWEEAKLFYFYCRFFYKYTHYA